MNASLRVLRLSVDNWIPPHVTQPIQRNQYAPNRFGISYLFKLSKWPSFYGFQMLSLFRGWIRTTGFAFSHWVEFDIQLPDTIGCIYPKFIFTYFDNCRITYFGKKSNIWVTGKLGVNLEHICNIAVVKRISIYHQHSDKQLITTCCIYIPLSSLFKLFISILLYC